MSVQWAAVSSQKLTVPGFTAVEPATTVAVSVTTDPDATVVTALPPLVTVSVVVVAVCANAGQHKPRTHAKAHIRTQVDHTPYIPPKKVTLANRTGKHRKCFIESSRRCTSRLDSCLLVVRILEKRPGIGLPIV
jgi:hypothetical protein